MTVEEYLSFIRACGTEKQSVWQETASRAMTSQSKLQPQSQTPTKNDAAQQADTQPREAENSTKTVDTNAQASAHVDSEPTVEKMSPARTRIRIVQPEQSMGSPTGNSLTLLQSVPG